jgi:hypothetical protein
MKENSPYKRKQGEQEIRILQDGRVVMIAPDEKLMEVAQVIDPDNPQLPSSKKKEKESGTKTDKREQPK